MYVCESQSPIVRSSYPTEVDRSWMAYDTLGHQPEACVAIQWGLNSTTHKKGRRFTMIESGIQNERVSSVAEVRIQLTDGYCCTRGD